MDKTMVKIFDEKENEIKAHFSFKYRGYTVVCDTVGEKPTIYPLKNGADLDDGENESCPSIESCLEWIDVDIACRAEET